MGEAWSLVILRPMLNILVVLYWLLGKNFGLSIVVFTALVRVVTAPLTLKQMGSMRATQDLQPKLKELERKYGSDRQRYTQEQMKLYKERGVNPLGGCLPILIQMPIWLGLYQSILRMLGSKPEELIDLYRQLYLSLPLFQRIAQEAVPFRSHFLWLDMARPDPYYILPILVAGTSWLAQKLYPSTPSTGQGGSMAQSMQVFMPLMMGFMSLQFASGLALYWVASNVLQVVQQWLTSGRAGAPFKLLLGSARTGEATEEKPAPEASPPAEEEGLGGKKDARERRKKRRKRRG